ncbi:Uncharacterised protein [Chromobacterium violaceum]|uniref:Uncharacterized protein n=1 Tax=Chromobacterium violaceum TaxID=536 RepID=A0A447T3Y7_CHRVL|nr:Uncharacterised protein [Chromobacterium violaceum]
MNYIDWMVVSFIREMWISIQKVVEVWAEGILEAYFLSLVQK